MSPWLKPHCPTARREGAAGVSDRCMVRCTIPAMGIVHRIVSETDGSQPKGYESVSRSRSDIRPILTANRRSSALLARLSLL